MVNASLRRRGPVTMRPVLHRRRNRSLTRIIQSAVVFHRDMKTMMFAQRTNDAAKLAALDRVQAIIEFDLNGRILTANTNFLAVVGYNQKRLPVGRTRCSSRPTTRPRPNTAPSGTGCGPGSSRRAVPAHRQGRARGVDPGLVQPDPRPARAPGQGHQVRHRHHRPDPPPQRPARADRPELRGDRRGGGPCRLRLPLGRRGGRHRDDERADHGRGRRAARRLGRRGLPEHGPLP